MDTKEARILADVAELLGEDLKTLRTKRVDEQTTALNASIGKLKEEQRLLLEQLAKAQQRVKDARTERDKAEAAFSRAETELGHAMLGKRHAGNLLSENQTQLETLRAQLEALKNE